MQPILGREVKLDFSLGQVFFTLSASQCNEVGLIEDRLDAVVRAITNLVVNGLVPALILYNDECEQLGTRKTGMDWFRRNHNTVFGEVRVDIEVNVDLSVDLPDEHIDQLIQELVCVLLSEIIITSLSEQLSAHDLCRLGSSIDLHDTTFGMFQNIPHIISQLLSPKSISS